MGVLDTSAHRPFRFGVTNGAVADMASWVTAARDAEALGYATFLLPDTTSTPAPLPALAAAAAVTTTLHLGTWVLCDPLHNARQLVWEADSLQQLCGGRFELGIGAGRPGAEQDAARLGVPFGTPGERVTRLGESIALIRERLPQTPLMVAASGPRLLALAGRGADIVAFGWAPTTTMAQARDKVDLVRAAAEGRPADDGPVELAAGLIAVGDGPAPWLARMGVSVADLVEQDAVTVVTGSTDEMCDALERRRESYGVTYVTVPASAVHDFAPVVERLTGR